MDLEEKLATRYAELYAAQSRSGDWIDVEPPVPFVGALYGTGSRPRVLVYGSVENLNFNFEKARMTFRRNRVHYQKWKEGDTGEDQRSIGNWFPWVHMTPVSDGTLLTVARYLLEVFGVVGFSTNPDDFLQQLSVGNYGKFSLKSGEDYASQPSRLQVSQSYALADFDVLRPDIVVLPKTIFESALIGILRISNHKPTRAWAIYQTNAGVVNRTIRKQLAKVSGGPAAERAQWTNQWLQNIRGVDIGAYLDWVDWRVGRTPGSTKPDWHIERLSGNPDG